MHESEPSQSQRTIITVTTSYRRFR